MPKFNITLEYKQSEEYKELSRLVRSMAPDMPETLVDYCIGFHKANPLAYRQFKSTEKASSLERSPTTTSFVIDGAVSVMDPVMENEQ